MGFTRLALVGALITVSSSLVAQSASEPWSLTALKAQTVPALWMLDGSDFVRYKPTEGEGFLEIQGRLSIAPGTRFDPVPLAEIRVRSAMASAAERPRSAFAVGSSIAMCRYLSPELRGREVAKMAVGDERHVTISRASPTAPLKFAAEGVNIDLCIAVPASGRVGDSLVLEFAGQAYPVALIDKAQTASSGKPVVGDAATTTATFPWRYVAIGVASLILLAVIGSGVWWWRRRRVAPAAVLPTTVDYPAGVASPPSVVASPGVAPAAVEPATWAAATPTPVVAAPLPKVSTTTNVDERPSPVAADVADSPRALPPRRVAREHCRTTFSRVGSNAGPGKADFEAGLRLLQGERFAEAEARLGEAIGKGLPPTFECGAWSLRGQAAVNQGRIPQAIDYFLNALGGQEVTSQAALPAGTYLEVIYRTLGLRADADQMRTLVKAINGFDIALDPAAGKRLQEATRAYGKSLRATHASLLTRLLQRVRRR